MKEIPLRSQVGATDINATISDITVDAIHEKNLRCHIKLSNAKQIDFTVPGAVVGPSVVFVETMNDGYGVETVLHSLIGLELMLKTGMIPSTSRQYVDVLAQIQKIRSLDMGSLCQAMNLYYDNDGTVGSTEFSDFKPLFKQDSITVSDESSRLSVWAPSGVTVTTNDIASSVKEDAKTFIKLNNNSEMRTDLAHFKVMMSDTLYYYKVLVKLSTLAAMPATISLDNVLSVIDSTLKPDKLNKALSNELSLGSSTTTESSYVPDSIVDVIASVLGKQVNPILAAILDNPPASIQEGGSFNPLSAPLRVLMSGEVKVVNGVVTIGGKNTDQNLGAGINITVCDADTIKDLVSLYISILSLHKSTRYDSVQSEIVNKCDNPRLLALLSKKVSYE